MNNVVSLASFRKIPPPEPVVLPTNSMPQEVIDFNYYLQEWAQLQNIDIHSMDFKYDAATISIVLQGMLAKQ